MFKLWVWLWYPMLTKISPMKGCHTWIPSPLWLIYFVLDILFLSILVLLCIMISIFPWSCTLVFIFDRWIGITNFSLTYLQKFILVKSSDIFLFSRKDIWSKYGRFFKERCIKIDSIHLAAQGYQSLRLGMEKIECFWQKRNVVDLRKSL